jgi:hypothetical protein
MFNLFKKKPEYNRDYIIGTICSIISAEIEESGAELFGKGKIVISTEVRSVGWIGPSATARNGYSVLLNMSAIPEDEKTLLDMLLKSVSEKQGRVRDTAVDMAALIIHKCLMKSSEFYRGLKREDPRLR